MELMSLTGLVDRFPLTGILLLLILGALGLPFPEDMTLILCGILIANDILEPVTAVVLVYVVLVGIDFVVFLLGKKYGPVIVSHKRLGRIVSAERLAQLEQKFQKYGVLFILLGRHLAVVRTQIVLAAGVFRMAPYKFLAADAVTIPVTMAFMIGMGYAGANSLQIVKKDITRVEHIALLFGLGVVLLYLMYRYFKYRRL